MDELDEVAIRRVVDRYFSAVDSRDPDRMRACYTDDAEFTALAAPDGSGGTKHVGIDACVEVLRGTEGFAATCHVTGNVVVEVDGDTATADTFAVAFVLPVDNPDSKVTVRGVRYRDTLARSERGWLIRTRVHSPQWQASADASALALPGATQAHLSGD